MYYDTKEATMTNECTSSTSHFDGLGGAPQQYRWHHPMQHVQGYSGIHWMPPSGAYLIRIAPVAARATANKRTTKNIPKRLAILMRRFRALLDATTRHHRVSIAANSCNWSSLPCFFFFFVVNLYKMVAGQC